MINTKEIYFRSSGFDILKFFSLCVSIEKNIKVFLLFEIKIENYWSLKSDENFLHLTRPIESSPLGVFFVHSNSTKILSIEFRLSDGYSISTDKFVVLRYFNFSWTTKSKSIFDRKVKMSKEKKTNEIVARVRGEVKLRISSICHLDAFSSLDQISTWKRLSDFYFLLLNTSLFSSTFLILCRKIEHVSDRKMLLE